LLGSALNEQGGGASLRLGRGGIPSPTPPLPPRPRFRRRFFRRKFKKGVVSWLRILI